MTKKPTKKQPTPRRRGRLPISQEKIEKFAEAKAQNKSNTDAVLAAGYKQSRKAAAVTANRLLARPEVQEAVARRRAEAMRRAQIHSDELIGMLAEIATASIGDVLDDDGNFDLAACKAKGTDHLLKKVRKVERHSKAGSRTTYEYEMYSRTEAIDQLRDTFGMKQEPRKNEFARTREAQVERSLHKIMQRHKLSMEDAAKQMLRELGDDSPQLAQVISKYVN